MQFRTIKIIPELRNKPYQETFYSLNCLQWNTEEKNDDYHDDDDNNNENGNTTVHICDYDKKIISPSCWIRK